MPPLRSRAKFTHVGARLVSWVEPLEQQFQSKLNLPCRTEVARREARTLYLPERPAGRGENRIAEVWMIENVEELASELKIEFFGDLGVLRNGEISIEEVGANNGVAGQVSGVTGAGDDGISTSAGLSGFAVECARYGKEEGMWVPPVHSLSTMRIR